MKDTHSLSHTKWSCKYHIVFEPKYRRKLFYESRRLEIRAILRELCRWKGVTILEAEVCSDHVHMLLEIPPKMSVSGFMGFLKGKSSLMIYEKWGNMRYKYRNRQFWCRGYYVDTTGKNTKKIKEYIANQLEADITKYGLFTYEEFKDFVGIPIEVFEAFNSQYLKVSICKGLITIEELNVLVLRYKDLLNIE